jgi:hypothetical protein
VRAAAVEEGVDAVASVAEECAVAVGCAQAVAARSAPQEVARIAAADSVAALDARLRCRDPLGFRRR